MRLHGVGIIKALDRADTASDDIPQIGADLVFAALIVGVAGAAFFDQFFSYDLEYSSSLQKTNCAVPKRIFCTRKPNVSIKLHYLLPKSMDLV